MKKLTAVDILYKFLYEMESFNGFDPYNFNHKELFEQANKMFEEQIKDAWFDGVTNWDSEKEVEDYINETFKSE